MITIRQLAKRLNLTSQAIYVSIQSGKLKAKKDGKNWAILEKDIQEYLEKKHSRITSMHNGSLTFDNKKGEYSVSQCAKILKHPLNFMYYQIRANEIKFHRKGWHYVIMLSDIKAFAESKGISLNL